MRFIILLLLPISVIANTISTIPDNVQRQMIGTSWHEDCPVPLSDLRYVTVDYWGYDNRAHQGVLIVNKIVASEVSQIFAALYVERFPIQSIKPMYLFAGDDEKAMEKNNTSSFNCRPVTGTQNTWSWHSYGLAIDINTRTNPYIKDNLILPSNAINNVSRDRMAKGLIKQNDFTYRLFTQHEWQWGGDWILLKDYQHFEKPM